jgi:hypothetical protein
MNLVQKFVRIVVKVHVFAILTKIITLRRNLLKNVVEPKNQNNYICGG